MRWGAARPRRGARLRTLTPADLAQLDGCPACPPLSPTHPDVRAALDTWGWCGVSAVADGRLLGQLVLTPLRDLDGTLQPGEARLLRLHPVSTVDGEARSSDAVARQLLEGAAARLLRSHVAGLQATGHRWAGDCAVPPVALLASRGFVVVVQHAVHPTMRLGLDRTVRGQPVLQGAWQRLTQLVSTPPPPEPIGFVDARRNPPAEVRGFLQPAEARGQGTSRS
ncbi:hypothetical protein GC722_02795 [Auraticoccus sp. F435]|uniref:GNAT family N-acetyltransferase n=1 Tax=Auraticoccus cholistanensis TaxID=2656650 RepID=A0A6A9UQL3_9ACTN|nr:hypothetical protein [Auraticoccus cholistanensis]MVA74961.1 hypothetical protein [Auraticoccus cholistanensis]